MGRRQKPVIPNCRAVRVLILAQHTGERWQQPLKKDYKHE